MPKQPGIVYCENIHGKDYAFPGTRDCAIYDKKSDRLMLYSIVKAGGDPIELQIYPVMKIMDLHATLVAEGLSLSEIFEMKRASFPHKVTGSCVEGSPQEIQKLVEKDIAQLNPQDQQRLDTAILEVFS